jgi:NAD(P)-dependent dehydrogenase (short-subunit alcohol dehydrogenase family)
MDSKNILIVGGSWGLGSELVKYWAARAGFNVFATTPLVAKPLDFPPAVVWLRCVDMRQRNSWKKALEEMKRKELHLVVSRIIQYVPWSSSTPAG